MDKRLSILNPQPRRLEGPAYLHDLVTRGEQPAIEYHDFQHAAVHITYDELHRRADILAADILAANSTSKRSSPRSKHFIIPLLVPQCPELYISQLAILKAGGAFCPLPIDAPEERLRFIVKDVSACIVLTDGKHQSRFDGVEGITIIRVDKGQDLVDHRVGMIGEQDKRFRHHQRRTSALSPTPLLEHRSITTQDLAYVMYTSGSTGLPKGVLLPHSAAVQALLAHDRHIPAYTRFLQFAAPTFDVSVFEIFFTLFRRQTIICCERTHLLSDLPGTINALHIDAAELTPSVASNLLGPREGVKGLKVLLTIGEMLKKDVIERYGGDENHTAVLHGMYGPTEATIHCTLQPDFARSMNTGNIGFPLDTVSAFIIQPSTEDGKSIVDIVQYGDEGELAIGGHQLAVGYLNRDEQTKAAFINHAQYGPLYRTGDKARMIESGIIECLGRIAAGQVKLRGQRLELGEVEYAVAKTPGCTGAVAEVIDDTLVVFCQANIDTTSEDEVLAVCKRWLPAYMLPSELRIQSQLPYLPSGKVDRRALRANYKDDMQCQTTEISSANQSSELKNIIQQVLGKNAVKDERLIGIDSLSSIRIVSALNKLGYRPPMATQIMAARSISDFMDVLMEAQASKRTSTTTATQLLLSKRREEALLHPLLATRAQDIQTILPCSAVQSAMLASTATQKELYCNSVQLSVTGTYSIDEIEAAINILIAKHELLRAGFLPSSSGYDLIIFKHRSSKQVQRAQHFDASYDYMTDDDFLSPVKFHVLPMSDNTRLLIQIHHALYDQWSIDILKRDLSCLLQHTHMETYPFSQVLKHYIETVDAGTSEKSLSFWQDFMANAQPTTFPNTNSIKSSSTQHQSEWIRLDVNSSHLHKLAHKHNWSDQSIFQTVYAYLLGQYVGNTDVVYGTVLSGRHIAVANIDQIFGPTLTTLPARTTVDSTTTWRKLVEATHKMNRCILQHSAIPGTQIKRYTDLAADEVLFDTLFIWQGSTITFPPDQCVQEVDSIDRHEFKLAIEIRPTADFFEARVTHDLSIIPLQQAKQIAYQLEAITNLIIEDQDSTPDGLHLRLPDTLLSISNSAFVHAAEGDLAQNLEQVVKQHAQVPAIMFATSFSAEAAFNSVTFETLHCRANQVAHYLREHGVHPDDLVCICMEKSIDFYIAVLGIVKSGAGYLPMVPEISQQRARSILQQAQVKIVLTDGDAVHLKGITDQPVLNFLQLDLKDYPSTAPMLTTQASHVAYTVFTSGSTGVPKGVSVTRGNLLGNLRVLQDLYTYRPGDRILQACLQSFDVAVFEIFFAFLSGMTICTATRDVLFEDLLAAIRRFQVTHLSMTPTVASLVHPDEVPSVKFLVTAGEAMTAAVHRAWSGRGLHQGYGPSETTNICTVNMDITPQHHLGSIGAPFSNTSAFVINQDQNFEILPQGAYGEFAFGGEQVFRGYLGLEDLNRQKIISHPKYGKLYRSGDMGRILTDGTLLIHGRSDFQVKIRGNRVELGEINAAILKDDSVEDCFTITTKDEHTILVAYWTPKGKTTADSKVIQLDDKLSQIQQAIFAHLETTLPSYMVPSFILPVNCLPRTAQGKMDMKALEALFNSLASNERLRYSTIDFEDDGEQGPFEDLIRRALAEMLAISISDIDARTSFDAFGLNSINVTTLAKSLSRTLDRQVQASHILRNATVRKLARALHQTVGVQEQHSTRDMLSDDIVNHVLSSAGIDRNQVEMVLPCTPLQEAMLAAGEGPQQQYYNNSTFKIIGDIERLKEAFLVSFQRHAILRTIFSQTQDNDHPYAQVVLKGVELPWIDSSTEQHSTSSIDPRQPISLQLHREGSSLRLNIQMHHAVYDGSSMSILLSEIESLYHQHTLAAAPSPLPFLKECIRQRGSNSREYWSRRVSGFQSRPFSRSNGPPSEQRHSRTLNIDLNLLQSAAKQHAASITVLLQAAWTKALALLQDHHQICFGDVVNGRLAHINNVDALVAPCFNTIPVLVDLQRIPNNLELIQKLQKAKDLSQEHQLSPLKMIQRLSARPDRHLFDSLLLVQPLEDSRDDDIWHLVEENGIMGFPLVLEIILHKTHPSIVIYDNIGISSLSELAALFETSLQTVVRRPQGMIQDLGSHFDHLRGLFRLEDSQYGNKSAEDDIANELDWTPDEVAVREVLSLLSKVEPSKIDRHTSIYQLGLDSLNAAQIATTLRRKGYTLNMADIVEHRTPAGIARAGRSRDAKLVTQHNDRLRDFDTEHRAQALKHYNASNDDIESIRPCTPVQQGMLIQSISSQGRLYVNHIWLRCTQPFSAAELESACNNLKSRHPILRTGFVQKDDSGSPFMMVVQKSSYHQLTVLKINGDEADIENRISSEICKSLQDPPWRVSLLSRFSETYVVLSVHHAQYDATGIDTLLTDLDSALQNQQLAQTYDLDDILEPILGAVDETDVSSKAFWHEQLNAASISSFPSLTPEVVKQSIIEEQTYELGLSATELNKLCITQKCTVQAALQAAWAKLLSEYLGEQSVTFGTVLSSRHDADHDHIIFPCITTIPISMNVREDSLIQDMMDLNTRLQRHRSTPLSDIQRYADKPGVALFDTVVVYQKTSRTQQYTTFSPERQSAAVDYKLSLELQITEDSKVLLRLSFANTILTTSHAKLMLQQYESIILKVLGKIPSQQPHGLLSITLPKQRSITSPFELLHQTVGLSAQQYPSQVALDFIWDFPAKSKQWTYMEVDKLGNKIAHLLRKHGASKTDTVAVCMDKCPEASFAFLGILKAGCAFLAMDPDLPKARKEYILNDSSAKILFTDVDMTVDKLETTTQCLHLSMQTLENQSSDPIVLGDLDPQSTCYCLYTSGTTGTPKGVEISHESAVQAMMAFQRLFSGHWSSASRWLQFASYWFDVSVLEHFWTWSVGATMVAAPRDLVLSDLVSFINEANITHIDLTPSLARLLEPEDVPCLCHGVFITGGEALKQEIIQKWGKYAVVCNGYGPTEATIGVTMNTFISNDAKPSNIGPAFDNVGTCVVDPLTLQPVMIGAIGELCVFGKLVGKGYLNRPDLTSSAFPILASIHERVYRTGDLVRQLTDGSFLFVGRKDSQAKLRGQRLEIDEIDSHIKGAHSSIADVASLVVKSDNGNKQTLVSFVAESENHKSGYNKVEFNKEMKGILDLAFASCRKFLPAYMVPTHIIPILKIPLTVNNKTDTKSLSTFYNDISSEQIQSLRNSTATKTDVLAEGHRLVEVVARMLAIDKTTIHGSANLFSLGMSSISAINLVSLLKRAGYKKANITTVISHPEINDLVRAITNGTAYKEDASIRQAKQTIASYDSRYRLSAARRLNIEVESIEAITPCTPLQQGIILESLRTDDHPYFNSFTFDISLLDIQRLRAALYTLAYNVEVLRASFVQTDDGFIQVITKEPHWKIAEIHAADQHQAISTARSQWWATSQDDLVRPFQPTIMTDKSVLYLQMHHAIYDGISLDLLLDNLARVYHHEQPDYGPKYTTCLAYGPLRTVEGAEQYWQKALSGINTKPFPTQSTTTQEPTTIKLSTTFDALESTRQIMGVSHQALVQIAFQVALKRLSGHTNTFGIITSGRSLLLDGAERIIGPLFNTLPCRISFEKHMTWHEAAVKSQEWNSSTLPYQHTALRDIKKWCGYASDEPLFDALLVVQMSTLESSNDIFTITQDEVHAIYPLALEVEITGADTIQLTAVAQSTIMQKTRCETFIHDFVHAMECIIASADKKISEDFEVGAGGSHTAESSKERIDINGVHNFIWTKEACIIREELAQLAGLSTDHVDEHMSIFGIGLDSIDSVKLASRLRKHKINLKVSTILQAQTIPRMLRSIIEPERRKDMPIDLLEQVEQQLKQDLTLPNGLNVQDIEEILPATPLQEGLIAPMLSSQLREYFNHDLLRIDASTDLERLMQAWTVVVNTSQILRTVFVPVESSHIRNTFAQVVRRPDHFHFGRVDLTSSSQLDAVMEDIRKEVMSTITTRPPLRLTVVMINQEQHILLSIAHAQYDGHSLALLHNDVAAAYYNTHQVRPSPRSVINQALIAADSASVNFWINTLSGVKASPFKRRSTQEEIYRRELISSTQLETARAFCRQESISMQTLAQTCWSLVLAHHTQRLDVVFGAVLACRDSEDAAKVMFPIMNTVPVRAVLYGTRKDVLREVQRYSNDLLPHAQTPLRMIQAAFRKQKVAQSNGVLFESIFIYQQRPQLDDQDQLLYNSELSSSSIDYPVAAEMDVSDNQITFRVAVQGSVLSRADSRILIRHLDQMLSDLISAPQVNTLSFLDEEVSVCGLPSFKLHETASHTTSVASQTLAPDPEDDLSQDDKHTESIIRVLAEVSNSSVDDISSSSTLESLGIDSISAIKVTSLLKTAGVRLTVGKLLRAGSVGKIGAFAVQQSASTYQKTSKSSITLLSTKDLSQNAAMSMGNIETILPALAGQIYMLSIWSRTSGRLFYPTFSYHLDSEVTLQQIHRAWTTLVMKHAILRTVFTTTSRTEYPVAQVVLKAVPDTFREHFSAMIAQQPFAHLQAARGKSGWDLQLKIHHALYDAVSLDLIVKDLSHLINNQTITASGIQLDDYISSQQTSASRDDCKAFWTQYLGNLRSCTISSASTQATGRVEIYRPSLLADAKTIEHKARKLNLSIQSVLFAAWAKVYARNCQSLVQGDDVIFGIYLSNRSQLDGLMEVRAPTLNLVPLRIKTALSTSLSTLAASVQRDLAEISTLERSSVALWELQEWTGVEIDTFLNFVKLPDGDAMQDSTISNTNLERETERCETTDMRHDQNFRMPDELHSMPRWDGAYKDSLDIEMTIAHGSLDVGVFALESIVGLEQAKSMLDALKLELSSL